MAFNSIRMALKCHLPNLGLDKNSQTYNRGENSRKRAFKHFPKGNRLIGNLLLPYRQGLLSRVVDNPYTLRG